jgi:diacylglycerol kinase
MESSNKFSFNKLIRSFGFAITGLKELFRSEQNARIHLIISIFVLIAGVFFKISILEWCVVLLCIGMVISAEALNTVVEKLVDHLFPNKHETARQTKDLAAGAVLILAIISVVCGILIFLPKIILYIF